MVKGFIQEQDYGTLIDRQALAVLEQTQPENRARAEQMAREELTDYLSGRYNTARAFACVADERNMRLVMTCMDIALYHMVSWLPQNMGMSVREKRYDKAVEWMEAVRDGKLNPDLPPRGDEGQSDYDPATASVMKWGSNTKNDNDW